MAGETTITILIALYLKDGWNLTNTDIFTISFALHT